MFDLRKLTTLTIPLLRDKSEVLHAQPICSKSAKWETRLRLQFSWPLPVAKTNVYATKPPARLDGVNRRCVKVLLLPKHWQYVIAILLNVRKFPFLEATPK